ncbi:MAG: lyase family protein, partial [Planctomycetota bacterium]
MASPSRSGVFDADSDALVEAFGESISFDRRMYSQDIRGSIAHAQMLCQQGILSDEECDAIVGALGEIKVELDEDRLPMRQELEDIHMHVEQALIERLGDTGRKLHTGRSRNDQVSTDSRLWVRGELERIDALLVDLQRAFVERCDADFDVILPAYTHLQRAQPVLAPH